MYDHTVAHYHDEYRLHYQLQLELAKLPLYRYPYVAVTRVTARQVDEFTQCSQWPVNELACEQLKQVVPCLRDQLKPFALLPDYRICPVLGRELLDVWVEAEPEQEPEHSCSTVVAVDYHEPVDDHRPQLEP
ncbi:hypothetical protein [Klebsiella pneumoniae]|uniref:hypothetical protein n=1 Tax=Klebsiella pneumoniae TaxID=573 RepID=UPI0011E4DD82|nr:hypothetical protein [Klebsiella pneumoniae]